MKNTFKKLSVLSVGLLMVLVGCGKNDTPTTGIPTTNNPSTNVNPTTPVTKDNIDIDIRLEAEDGVIAKNILEVKENVTASNGKYVSGIKDCAEGLFFIHYAPVGGEHDIEIAYYLKDEDSVNSKHELTVNDEAQTIVYTEATGLGDTASKAGIATAKINLKEGYNVITLQKKGTGTDVPEYGGYAEIDYIDIKGTGKEYNKDTLDYNLDQIKIEAELAGFSTGTTCPVPVDGASNGYIVGEINSAGNGATFSLNLPFEGKYALQVSYGKDAGERAIDVKYDEQSYTYNLEDYPYQSWNYFNESNTVAVLDITKGAHTISVSRAENGNWFCFDYIVLTKIATVNEKVEAEDCLVDGTRVKANDLETASNGKYVNGLNDCGQGLYLLYKAPVAGEYTLEAAYWTDKANSKTDVYVDGTKQGTLVYATETGLAETKANAEKVSINVTLKEGYNNIEVIKYGTGDEEPAWGGNVQLDYFIVKSNTEYNPNIKKDYQLKMIIDAELGNFYSDESCPVGIDDAQNGYVVGGINKADQGATFNIRVPETGKYELRIVYGKSEGARPVDIKLDDNSYTYSLEDYPYQAFNYYNTSEVAATLNLTEGTNHTLSITRAADSDWFCFDAIVLTKVVE